MDSENYPGRGRELSQQSKRRQLSINGCPWLWEAASNSDAEAGSAGSGSDPDTPKTLGPNSMSPPVSATDNRMPRRAREYIRLPDVRGIDSWLESELCVADVGLSDRDSVSGRADRN